MNSQEQTADQQRIGRMEPLPTRPHHALKPILTNIDSPMPTKTREIPTQKQRTKKPMTTISSAISVITAPFRVVKFFVDLLLSAAILIILAAFVGWAAGIIPQETTVSFLTDLGDKSLELARALGLPL